jgi:hypothetical protein
MARSARRSRSAVLPQRGTTPDDEVFFRPHADGISDLIYRNYDG